MYNLYHSRTGSSTPRPPAWYGADRGQLGRPWRYEDTCTQVPGYPPSRCRAQLEMQVRPQGRQDRSGTQRSHTRTHTSPQEQGSCLDRDVTAASILLFPIVDLCFGRHPDQTHTWNDWLVPRLPPGSSAAAPSRFRLPPPCRHLYIVPLPPPSSLSLLLLPGLP